MPKNIYPEASKSDTSNTIAYGLGNRSTPNIKPTNKKHVIVDTSSPISKKKTKPNITGLKSTSQSLFGRKSYSTYLKVLLCKEENVWIADLSKPDDRQAYSAPYKNMLTDDPHKALDHFHIIGIAARRDPSTNPKDLPLPQGPDSNYGRTSIVCFRDTNETIEEFGDSLAAKLTSYANTSEAFIGTRNHFIYHHDKNQSTELAHPVNYYLRNRDTLLLLKKVYGSEGITKSEIIEDHDILIKFFGEVQTGIDFLGPLSEDQWQNIEL